MALIQDRPISNRKPAVIDKNLENLAPGRYSDQTFFNCTFRKLNSVTFDHCTMQHSKVVATDPRDLLGLTVTLNCQTFQDVELSPEAFDLFLCLLLKTKGNTEKRRQLIDVIGRDRVHKLLTELKHLE